jgi:hypothetical protein
VALELYFVSDKRCIEFVLLKDIPVRAYVRLLRCLLESISSAAPTGPLPNLPKSSISVLRGTHAVVIRTGNPLASLLLKKAPGVNVEYEGTVSTRFVGNGAIPCADKTWLGIDIQVPSL